MPIQVSQHITVHQAVCERRLPHQHDGLGQGGIVGGTAEGRDQHARHRRLRKHNGEAVRGRRHTQDNHRQFTFCCPRVSSRSASSWWHRPSRLLSFTSGRESAVTPLQSVQWQASVEAMVKAGASKFVELGPRDQLKAMMKRINMTAWKNTSVVNP